MQIFFKKTNDSFSLTDIYFNLLFLDSCVCEFLTSQTSKALNGLAKSLVEMQTQSVQSNSATDERDLDNVVYILCHMFIIRTREALKLKAESEILNINNGTVTK